MFASVIWMLVDDYKRPYKEIQRKFRDVEESVSLNMMLENLHDADELERAQGDKAIRAVVVTGSGGHFCSGGDISGMDIESALAGRERMRLSHQLIRLMVLGSLPVVAAVEGFCVGAGLSLDGVDDYVAVPHTSALDAYPLTVSAWFRTTTQSGLKGLVNKYSAGSFDGYEVFLHDGDLCAWFFRDGSRYVYDGGECTLRTSGFNDGLWHHVAFVVGSGGGKLYVDGVLTASRAWTGAAGAPSTQQELRLGHYPAVTGDDAYLAGDIDEVRIYDRALTAQQVLKVFGEAPPLP